MTAATAAGALTETMRLRADAYRGASADGGLYLVARSHHERVGPDSDWCRSVLGQLAARPCSAAELAAGQGTGDVAGLLSRLRGGGWLQTTRYDAGGPLFTSVPLGRPEPPASQRPADLAWAPMLAVRQAGHDVLVEAPGASGELYLHDQQSLAALAELGPLPAPGGRSGAVAGRLAAALRDDLARHGLLTPPAAAGQHELASRQWGQHELWFHARSRIGSRGAPGRGFGGTWWARGRFEPLPARRPAHAGPVTPLAAPDLTRLRRDDPTLTAVIEDRQSIREHDDAHPITVGQLSEFLYRCGRVRRVAGHGGVELISRPYPSGGASGELELYPAVWQVDGLSRGLYHYDAHEHRLVQAGGPEAVHRIIADAVQAAQLSAPPQLVVVVAARFGRVMWKYQSMAYALILKHVGVLYELMYLVAGAMGLAPCALGAGDAGSFSRVAGLDPLAESSVGEFLLGSRPRRPRPEPAAGA